MNLPIRAAHAREAWLAMYLKWIERGDDIDEATAGADLGLCEYVERFGDPDLRKDLDECFAIRDGME
jgi:hypothetical protein